MIKLTSRFSKVHILLLATLVLGLALRLYGIKWGLPDETHPDYSYHPDEAFMLEWAGWLVHGHIIPKHFIYGGTLYFTILNAYMFFARLFGEMLGGFNPLANSILVGRYFHTGVALLTILLVFECGRQLFGRRAGLVAALLLSVVPAHVILAQQVRPDVLGVFFVVLMLYLGIQVLTVDAVRHRSLLGAIGLCLGATAALRIPLVIFGVMPLTAMFLAMRTWPGGFTWMLAIKKTAFVGVCALAAYVVLSPHTLIYYDYAIAGLRVTWWYESYPFLDAVDNGPLFYQHLWLTLRQALGDGQYFLAVVGVFYALRRRTAADIMILSGLAGYAVLTSFASWTVVRYSLPMVPLLVLLAARALTEGMDEIRPRSIRVGTSVLLVAVLTWSLFSVLAFVRVEAAKNVREIASEWILANIPAGSAILMLKSYDRDFFFNPVITNPYVVGTFVFSKTSDVLRGFPGDGMDYIVLNESLYKNMERLGERHPLKQSRLFYQGLTADFRLVQEFKLPIRFAGIDFSGSYTSNDYSFVNPGIRIYERRERSSTVRTGLPAPPLKRDAR
jgi:hypothetical protein